MKRHYIITILILLSSAQSYALNSKYVSEEENIKFSRSSAKAISQNTLVFHDRLKRYSISNLFDNNPGTAWATKFIKMSDAGPQTEEEIKLFENGSLKIVFDDPIYLDAISILNVYQKNDTLFHDNERARTIKIEKVLIGGPSYPLYETYTLKDSKEIQTISLTNNWPAITNLFKTKEIIITVEGIYPGNNSRDLCISELNFKFLHETPYSPRKKWNELRNLILINRTTNKTGWDLVKLSENNHLMTDFLYYILNNNSEAYDLFKTYHPYSTIGSELMSNIYEPGVEKSLHK